jgi:hypothetical protein
VHRPTQQRLEDVGVARDVAAHKFDPLEKAHFETRISHFIGFRLRVYTRRAFKRFESTGFNSSAAPRHDGPLCVLLAVAVQVDPFETKL